MLQTLQRTVTDSSVQTLQSAQLDALHALCDGGTLPLLPPDTLRTTLDAGRILGDFAGTPDLQAAAALLPLFDDAVLPASLRAAGYGADGQGAVLTPPQTAPHYTQLRQFLRTALRLATARYASYHVWAVLPLEPERMPVCEDLCAQYLAAGLTLRGVRPMAGTTLLIFSARGLPHWREPYRRLHLGDPALPRMLERGYAVGDFGWGAGGMELILRNAQ